MLSMTSTKTGIAITTIQAPWVNLDSITTTRTTDVMAVPRVLSAVCAPCCAGSRCRPRRLPQQSRQYTTMPAWLRVKETKTPTM